MSTHSLIQYLKSHDCELLLSCASKDTSKNNKNYNKIIKIQRWVEMCQKHLKSKHKQKTPKNKTKQTKRHIQAHMCVSNNPPPPPPLPAHIQILSLCMHEHTFTCTYIQTCEHTHTHAHKHTLVHTQHTCTHTQTHTHTHTHTHTQVIWPDYSQPTLFRLRKLLQSLCPPIRISSSQAKGNMKNNYGCYTGLLHIHHTNSSAITNAGASVICLTSVQHSLLSPPQPWTALLA